MRVFAALLTVLCLAATANAALVDVRINEILVDPTVGGGGFDTDGDGSFENADEFIEFYNAGAAPVDISSWQVYVGSGGSHVLRHTFSAGTSIASGGLLTLVASYTGTVPAGFVGSDENTNFLGNGGDNIALYDPTANQFSSYVYNGDPAITAGLPAGATLFGSVIDMGSDVDGLSIAALPDGSTSFSTGAPTPGQLNAVPEPSGLLCLLGVGGLVVSRRRLRNA